MSAAVVAVLTVAVTREPLAPANVTELLAGVALKATPLMVIVPPRGPAFGVRLVMDGAGGGGVAFCDGGAARPMADWSDVGATTDAMPTPVPWPPSGLVTITSRGPSAASTATSTVAVIVDEFV